MATPVIQINHITIPSNPPYYMGTGGTIVPKPPAVVRQNGAGQDVVAGYSSFEWSWEVISISDYAWWATTILYGTPSAIFNHAYLYNYLGVLTTYGSCVVHRPTFEKIVGDTYQTVRVVIDQLI